MILGLAVRRNRMALVALVIGVIGLFMWGTSTGISDNLYDDAQATGLCLVEASARAIQARIRGDAVIADPVPNPLDLPEGLSSVDFQREYGGLGGEKTTRIVEEIQRRLDACEGLR
ncbi:MAG: hypothetical protein GY809_21345 [Planctomycetes bacterium]|nr:hypothetical protein [Planctomycetota bacterium]